MADSQSIPTIFSLRIVSIDYYAAPPIPAVDVCYSSFQGGKVKEVPVIRIYGSTPAGQKTCLHIHKAFPYLYVPCSDIPIHPNQRDDAAYTDTIALALEKALKLRGSAASKRQHVHGCSLVRAKRFYGFHSSEELFVKIYLYHPHDVSRAANLLLGGAVLGKNLQPHESHIPFILQFLVDYNLYGMGHVHLSKMKFRNPVPDFFTQRKYNYRGNNGLETDEKTSFPADIQSDLAGGECLHTPVWVSSTIQGEWMWQFSNEFDAPSDHELNLVKRLSTCELEGDATVNDIINQQFKTYASLSQTHSDVKMVQSLVAIWEEEYERTGMHEATTLTDSGRPLPDDVLKTLSHSPGFERELAELCGEAEENFSLIETIERFQQSSRSIATEEYLVGHENFNSDNANGESLKCYVETDCNMSLSLQGSLREARGAALKERGNAYPTSFPVSDVQQSSEMIETLNSKAPDKEALGLLRWLATSQAAEDINSDDELVCEPILSPLLPAITIDKVLEKANSDYESESQKECQDILNSIDNIVNSEGLPEKESHSLDCSHYPQTSEENTLVDASPQHEFAGNSSDSPIKDECNRYSGHQVSWTGGSFASKRKRKNLLWCSLPFSVNKNVNADLESGSSDMVDMYVSDNKEQIDTPVAGGRGRCSDAFVNNQDAEASGSSALVRCSVRDLMRRKRCHRAVGVTNVQLEEPEECNIILPKKLNLHTLADDERGEKFLAIGSPGFRQSATSEQSEITVGHVSEAPLISGSDDPLQGALEPPSAGAQRYKLQHAASLRKHFAVSITHFETNSGKGYGGSTSAEAITSNGLNPVVGSSSGQRLEVTETVSPSSSFFAVGRHKEKDGHEEKDWHAVRTCNHRPNNNLIETAISTDATDLQETSSIIKHEIGCSVAITTSMQDKPVDLISTTFCKKPPLVDLKDGASEDISFSNPPSCHSSHFKENKDGASGSASDDFPFCEVEYKVQKKFQNKSLPGGDYNVQREPLSGVPTYYQNDGSLLYILMPALTPPSADSVRRWLAHDQGDAHGEPYAASDEPPSRKDVDGVLTGSDLVEHVLDEVQQETNRNTNGESQPCLDEVQKVLQTEGNIKELNAYTNTTINESQISGPDGRLRSTPLSQIGFRDPASIGAGQQLTLLSLEIQAESRGDLRPDPRMDAIQVVSLAFQSDNDSAIDVFVLFLSETESWQRSIDGIFGYKMFSFSEEKHLFSHFIRLIGSFDPDILMGWDVQGGSLGFLAERAAHLGIGLLNEISRTPLAPNPDHTDAEVSEKGITDVMLHELSITDSTIVEDSLIEDEWGRTHASGLHVGGRIVLNVWRLMRGEVKLNMYTAEAVTDAVLRRKIPSIPYKVLTRWFSSGSGRARYRCIEYVTVRAKLNLEIMNQLDMINRTSELARIFGIDFFSVLSRGSQYRVESMFLRLAHTQNYLAVSPGNQQVASQPAMECLPLVMEPESGFYADPVVVLDFQSLYPSMIIAYNLCFCTCLGSVAPSKADRLGVCSFSLDQHLFHNLKEKLLVTPNGVMYVPSKVREGVLPRLLEEILATRIMVKQAMKKLNPSQQVLHRILNARQLALKLIANVTYGYTAAGFSGRMPCAELADSIVQCGRSTLEKAISLVNANDKWRAKVIYGDTDSMFVLLKGRTVEESFQIGREIASAVTSINPDPVTLKLEKVYQPCFLLTKKRYVGYSYESADQTVPTFDAKGIETVRRDTCGAVAKMMEQSLRLFFEHQDIYEIKTYLQRQWTRILSGRVSLQDFVFAKEVRLGTYRERTSSSLPPAAIVATKAMKADPRAEPRYAERVPYVVIHGEPGARLVDMVVDPMDLLAIDSPFRLNDIYYITKQIIPALQRVFGLVGADLNQWFSEMPRPAREALTKRPLYGSNPQRTRIDYYYLSKHCVLCGELVQSSSHVCNKCLRKETAVATAIIGRTSKLEREMQHLVAICRHCGGGDWLIESGVKCTSLACPVFYERRKVQKELQGLSAVAADKGFYPKCMVEWF